MHKIYTDKENFTAASVNAAKATLAGPLKSKPQARKPFGNVGNTIQSRRPSPSSPLKANIKSSLKVLKKSSPESLLPKKKTEAETKNVSPTNDDDWPEIEHMPPFYEPEDNYEDIWPREERLSHDDLLSLKFLQNNKASYDASVCPDTPDSPIEPYLLEFSALDQSMFKMDCLEEPSKLNDILRPVPSQENYEGIWPQEERLSDDDLMSLKFLQHYACPVSPISPLDQSMFKMDSPVQEPSEIH